MTAVGTSEATDAARTLMAVVTRGAVGELLAPEVAEEAVRALSAHGDLGRWFAAWCSLPQVPVVRSSVGGDAPSIDGESTLSASALGSLRDAIVALRPWRKGPFALFGEFIDAEWRCSLKWSRLAPHVDFRGCSVLDVGCGNGYYCLRAVGAGARVVLGVDPSVLSAVQFASFKRYLPELPAGLLPLPFERLPLKDGGFDRVLSMGVLYHRRAPLLHIDALRAQLNPEGVLVLETLVLPEGHEGLGAGGQAARDARDALVPEGRRYAGMPNVWCIPSVATLSSWLRQCGFVSELVALAQTNSDEQRVTALSGPRSLEDTLDDNDCSRTIEGYPRPLRAMLVARLEA